MTDGWKVWVLACGLVGGACTAPPEIGPVPQTVVRPDTSLLMAESRVGVDGSGKRVIVYVGPFDVLAMSGADEAGEHAGHDMHEGEPRTTRPLMDFAWPIDGWLRGLTIRVEAADGTPLPSALIHHLIIYNLGRRQLLHPGVERLIGAGRETGDIIAPASAGVPLASGEPLAVRVTWHNETGQDLRNVYVRLELPYTPYRADGIPYAGRPMYADAYYEMGTSNAFDLPPGRSERSFEFAMPLDGGLIGVGGHLHDYGVEVRLEDAETGRTLFRLRGLRNPDGTTRGVERRVFRSWFGLKDARIRLVAGHRYRVVGVYDNTTGRTIPSGGMAHFTGLFAPSDPAAWPVFDPDAPDVQEDIAVLRGEIPEHRRAAHGGH